jgi:hypothetical protein
VGVGDFARVDASRDRARLPWFTDPISWAALVTVLLTWLGIYVVVRMGARATEKMIFPGER